MQTDQARWQAVKSRRCAADGTFVYAVKTTGVYCRPSCGARLARRANVEFFSKPADAERAGFRACKRCRPNEATDGDHVDAVMRACRLIERADVTPDTESLAAAAGMSPSHFHRVFKSQTGLTPKAYASAHRARRVRDELARSTSVTTAALNAGFQSSSRFYSTAAKTLGMKPAAFRRGGAGATIRYAVGRCSLGSIIVAASDVGICFIALGDDRSALVRELEQRFHNADVSDGRRRVREDAAERDRVRRASRDRTRPAARHPRHRVPAARLAGAGKNPRRPHADVSRDRVARSGCRSRRALSAGPAATTRSPLRSRVTAPSAATARSPATDGASIGRRNCSNAKPKVDGKTPPPVSGRTRV